MIDLSMSDNTVTRALGNVPGTAAGLTPGYKVTTEKALPEAPFKFEDQHPLNIPVGASHSAIHNVPIPTLQAAVLQPP